MMSIELMQATWKELQQIQGSHITRWKLEINSLGNSLNWIQM